MTTKHAYDVIDCMYQNRMKTNGLAYNLRKTRNVDEVKVNIGRFESITDPYFEGYIATCLGDMHIVNHFRHLLEIAEKETTR